MGLHPDRVDATIRAAAPGHFLPLVYDLTIADIEGFGFFFFPGMFQTLRNVVYCDDTFRAEHVGAFDGELADRPAAPDGNRIAGLNVTILRRHVAGGEDVGEKQRLLVTDAVGNCLACGVGERYAYVL